MKRAAMVMGLAIASVACTNGEGEALPPVSAKPPTSSEAAKKLVDFDAPQRVETVRVGEDALRARIAVTGTLAARRVTEVAAEVHGRIVEVLVDVGDDVATEAPLFRIDPLPYQLAVDEARASLQLARAESANAREEAARLKRLVEQSVASQQQYDQLRTMAAVTRARVAAAEARLARAERDLMRTEVRAPYAGSIVARYADEGTMTGANPIVTMQESGALEAVLAIPETTPVPVRVGDPVRIYLEGRARPLETRVSRVSHRIDAETRTYEVRAEVVDESGLSKAGSYARAEVEPTRSVPHPVVRGDALLRRDGRTFVMRVEQGVAHRVAVRVGIQSDGRAEILEGIEVGQEIVAGDSVPRLADGARVESSVVPRGDESVSHARVPSEENRS